MTDSEITLPAPPTPSPQPEYGIFRGPNGIRAGWRALIFIVLAFAIGCLIISPLFLLHLAHPGSSAQNQHFGLSPVDVAIGETLIFVSTAVAALIMASIERRKWSQYGLPWRFAFRKDFWIGTLVGFASISVTLLAIFAFHGFRITGLATHGSALLSAAAAWSVAFIIVGLAEEFAFRGYLQYTLTTGMGFWPAALLLSISFAAAHGHNPGESWGGLLSIIVFALVFCFVLQRRGNLWWAVGFHAGWDWGQTFFYGVPDSGAPAYHNFLSSTFSGPRWLSGGTVGPEASIFTPIVLIIVALGVARVYRENLYRVENPNVPASALGTVLQTATTGSQPPSTGA